MDGNRKDERIIIVDVIGELFKVYSLATIVYCGGSLVPKGGQNILEAAAWGKVIFYGPSMEDFSARKSFAGRGGLRRDNKKYGGITARNSSGAGKPQRTPAPG